MGFNVPFPHLFLLAQSPYLWAALTSNSAAGDPISNAQTESKSGSKVDT